MKPEVFKMAGWWVWRCKHPSGWVGEEFHRRQVRDPWAVAEARAVQHFEQHHADVNVVERGEI